MAKFNILGDGSKGDTIKVKRKGVHAKTKSSTRKGSKIYVKKNIGQG